MCAGLVLDDREVRLDVSLVHGHDAAERRAVLDLVIVGKVRGLSGLVDVVAPLLTPFVANGGREGASAYAAKIIARGVEGDVGLDIAQLLVEATERVVDGGRGKRLITEGIERYATVRERRIGAPIPCEWICGSGSSKSVGRHATLGPVRCVHRIESHEDAVEATGLV